jgi:iron complex outermembrane receptor protein
MGYIYPRNTGELNLQTLLPIYQFTGNDALFYGFETIFKTHVFKRLQLYSSSSFTYATIVSNDTPVPFIPPWTTELSVSYQHKGWDVHASSTIATSQNRAGDFEEPTDGFILFGAGIERVFTYQNALHTLTLEIQNAFNTTYRNHLSRVKSVMPEPGANVRLLYRIYI